MSQKNRISASVSAEDKATVLANITSIQNTLSHMLTHSLEADDRRAMIKMGDKTVAFVQKSLDYAGNNPKIVPSYLDLEEANKDLKLSQDLQPIYNQLKALTTAIEDALMICGSEAYDAALIFYNAAKGAARSNIPGSEAILEDLQHRFPRKQAKAAPKN